MHRSMGEGDRATTTSASQLSLGRDLVTAARYDEAYETLMRASKLAHDGNDPAEESRCLSQLSYAAAALGHNEEAIETAMLASQLADVSGDTAARLMALNYLGVALIWNGSHEGAEAMLRPAFQLASDLGKPGQCWRPQINRCFNEAYRQIGLRHLERRQPEGQRLGQLMEVLHERDQGDTPQTLITLGLWQWLQAITAAWQQGTASAGAGAEAELAALCASHPELGLLQAMLPWLRCELALVDGRIAAAIAAAEQMRQRCVQIQQQPLLRMALRLACDLHEMQGETARALDCMRELQRSEHRLRQVSMRHRRDVASLRLELREHKREMQNLRSDAQQLQRLSMEDPLTSLANRRGLEQRLGAALGGHGRPEAQALLYVSVVDVNDFKGVNDRYSHQVGDRVLQTLAMLFQQQLRSQDIAGRWGGDEFVLAFWALDDAQAQAVAKRVDDAVARHAWSLLAPGLSVGISLGLTRALPGDTLDSLLLRSDLGMYENKRSAVAAAPMSQPL
jgi:diguanylate cyclase (GGDEF)-like protein